MGQETLVRLARSFFTEKERKIVEAGELSASLFLYDSGVAAVRISNARREATVLPFQGQQVWDARFDGRVLTMKSMFTQPHPTREYLATYGGFIIHCGQEDAHGPHVPRARELPAPGQRPPRVQRRPAPRRRCACAPPSRRTSGRRKGTGEFLSRLAADPALHNLLAPGLAFDPEVVLYIGYRADAEGWAHSMMVHPDGHASYIRHRPEQLDHGVRWISRTADQDCLGIVLPATAEPEGYTAEKAKGNVRSLAGGATARFDMEAGLLTPPQARDMEALIGRILAGK